MTISIIVFFISIILISVLYQSYEDFRNLTSAWHPGSSYLSGVKFKRRGFPNHLSWPTKCVDCERAIPDSKYKWLGGRTKCFSCEANLEDRYGSGYGSYAQPQKCFNCEPNSLRHL